MNRIRAAFVVCLLLLVFSTQGNAEQDTGKQQSAKNIKTTLREQLLGCWAPNQKALIKTLMTQSKAGLETGEVSKEEIEQMAKKLAGSMAFIFKADGTMAIHAAPESKKGTFKVLSSRPESSELDADLVASDGETEKVTLLLKNELLFLKPRIGDGDKKKTPEITLERISVEEFERRIKMAK